MVQDGARSDLRTVAARDKDFETDCKSDAIFDCALCFDHVSGNRLYPIRVCVRLHFEVSCLSFFWRSGEAAIWIVSLSSVFEHVDCSHNWALLGPFVLKF